MWSGVSRLLIGFVLFALAGWFLVHAAFGWNSVWQKQQVVAAKRSPVVLVDPTLASDPSIEDAKMKVIGPLANAVEPVENSSEIKQPPPSPAAPNAFDHVQKPTSSAPVRLHNTFVVKPIGSSRFKSPPTPLLQNSTARSNRIFLIVTKVASSSTLCYWTNSSLISSFTQIPGPLYSRMSLLQGIWMLLSTQLPLNRRSTIWSFTVRTLAAA